MNLNDPAFLRRLRRVVHARAIAMGVPPHDRDDLFEELLPRLVVAWPHLERIAQNDVHLFRLARYRLVWDLAELIRTRMKLRSPYDAIVEVPVDARAIVESDSIAHDVAPSAEEHVILEAEAEAMIDDLIAFMPAGHRRERLRYVCRRLAAGATSGEIGIELGVTDTRISQLLRSIREAAA